MKYLLLGFNNGNVSFNNAIQSFLFNEHPSVERVFEQSVGGGWPVATPQAVGVSTFPSLAFMALTGRKPNGEACYKVARIIGGNITRDRILAEIPTLPPIVDFSCGGGNLPGADGEGNWQNAGLFSLPPWLLALGTAYAGYKTVSAKTRIGQAAYGTLTAVWGLKYLQEQAEHESAPIQMGKTTDTLPIKPGSRAQQHWLREGLKDRDFTGRKKRYTAYTANPSDIVSRYNLHSIEFGNWVPQDERQQFLVGLDESLADLARILGVKQTQVGLGKTLAIAYGARGQGGWAVATYHPDISLINITRESGIGSLAHEYAHALDFHLSGTVTSAPTAYKSGTNKAKAYQLAYKAMELLTENKDGTPNNFVKRLENYRPYYRKRIEIWARSFEALIQSELAKKGQRNRLLTKAGYGAAVYPKAPLLRKARAAMLAYARYAINSRQTKKKWLPEYAR